MLLLVGKTIEEIISQNHNKWLRKRKEEIVKVGALSQVDMFIQEQCVNTVKYLDQMIGRLDDMIRGLVDE